MSTLKEDLQKQINQRTLSSAMDLISIEVVAAKEAQSKFKGSRSKSGKARFAYFESEIDSLLAASRVLDGMYMNV